MALPARGRAQDALATCGDPSAPYAQVQIDTAPRLDLELARTSQEHERGLMFVDVLPPIAACCSCTSPRRARPTGCTTP